MKCIARGGVANTNLEQCLVAERISVIVATYNRPDALDAVLRSLAHQSDTDFEVLVADDGSTQPTKELIESWRPRFNSRLHHVWHVDDGFRLAEIRNRAILAASGDYCIFLDGDCIARTDFRRRASRTGQARLVRDRQPAAAVAGAFAANPERKARAGILELCRLVAGAPRQ